MIVVICFFFDCKDIMEIDCSNFDCSQITNSNSMFNGCNLLEKVNLGKLDFPLSKDFSFMFGECRNLKELDISHFSMKILLI